MNHYDTILNTYFEKNFCEAFNFQIFKIFKLPINVIGSTSGKDPKSEIDSSSIVRKHCLTTNCIKFKIGEDTDLKKQFRIKN